MENCNHKMNSKLIEKNFVHCNPFSAHINVTCQQQCIFHFGTPVLVICLSRYSTVVTVSSIPKNILTKKAGGQIKFICLTFLKVSPCPIWNESIEFLLLRLESKTKWLLILFDYRLLWIGILFFHDKYIQSTWTKELSEIININCHLLEKRLFLIDQVQTPHFSIFLQYVISLVLTLSEARPYLFRPFPRK